MVLAGKFLKVEYGNLLWTLPRRHNCQYLPRQEIEQKEENMKV